MSYKAGHPLFKSLSQKLNASLLNATSQDHEMAEALQLSGVKYQVSKSWTASLRSQNRGGTIVTATLRASETSEAVQLYCFFESGLPRLLRRLVITKLDSLSNVNDEKARRADVLAAPTQHEMIGTYS